MFDVKQLRVLRAVAEHGSFSAAADALSYTQPAISQQIAALEKRAGTTLVDRGSRGVRLTDAGEALVEHAEVVIARLAAAEAELDAIAGVRGGRVRMSSFPSAGASLLPPAVALFSERRPLIDDPMYLAMPRDHPAARKARIRLQDVRDDTWIQNDTTGPCGRLHLAACAAAGFEPKIGFQSDDYNVVQGLIAAGVGVSLLPALSLTNVRDDIVVRSLGSKAPTRRIAAATLAGRYLSPATHAMLDILTEAAESFELPSGAAVAA